MTRKTLNLILGAVSLLFIAGGTQIESASMSGFGFGMLSTAIFYYFKKE